MFHAIVVAVLCLLMSGCASLGRWNGRREYRKSQIESKRVVAGYGYHYMLSWNLAKELDYQRKRLWWYKK